MDSHQLEYEIIGSSAQCVEIILDPGETVIAEAGMMNYMTEDVRFETRMGDGSATGVLGKLWSAGKRMVTGESLFMTHFSNDGKTQARVAFAAPPRCQDSCRLIGFTQTEPRGRKEPCNAALLC